MVIAMASSSASDEMEFAAETLLSKIASCPDAYFKSQQIDDDDLTTNEKRQIAREILEKGPSKFLARFGKHLNEEDLLYFDRFREDYEVTFYLNEIHKRDSEKKLKTLVKNRRYEALKRLIGCGEYFSDAQMKKRNPFLFEQLIGQYMSDREREELENKIDYADHRFTTILMEHMDRNQEECLRKHQEAEDGVEEEEETDSEGEDEAVVEPSCQEAITDDEKHMFRDEFLSAMYQKFLDGNETEFDYATVDENAEYDSVDETEQDAEDSYFDAEVPNVTKTTAMIDSDESMDYDADISNFLT